MCKALLIALVVGLLARSALADPTGARPGRVEIIPAVASAYVATRTVRVWLPDGYDSSKTRYPVIYMHDGQNLFDPAIAMGHETWAPDVVLAAMARAHRAPGVIVVGVDNTPARAREYMPEAIFERLPATDRDTLAKAMGGRPLSDAYLKFLVTELKPMIDTRFRTRTERRSTFIMGSSMGGLISLYALTEYPDVFDAAGCLSTHWPLPAFNASFEPSIPEADVTPAVQAYLRAALPVAGTRRLWFDHGDQSLDRFYGPYQRAVDKTLADLGWVAGRDFKSRVYPGGAHNEVSWRARLADPLTFLLSQARDR